MGIGKSPLLEYLEMCWVVSHDIGGWLFPDYPEADTPPNDEVVEFVRCLVLLWGNGFQCIIANVRSNDGWKKDHMLLARNDILRRCGLRSNISEGTFTDGSVPGGYDASGGGRVFRTVERPENKGTLLASDIVLMGNQPCVVIFDNRYRAMFCAPSAAHCVVYCPKDEDEAVVKDWLGNHRNDPTLHVAWTVERVAQLVAQIHLEEVVRAIRSLSDERRQRRAQRMLEGEIDRTEAILRPYGVSDFTSKYRS